MKAALEHVVVPMFCNASIAATEEQRQKLDKLLKLWESKSNYLKSEILDKMRNPLQSYQQYQADQLAKYTNEVSGLAQQTKVAFEGYQAQHQAFVCHAMQQIMDLQQQKQTLEHQVQSLPHQQVQHPQVHQPVQHQQIQQPQVICINNISDVQKVVFNILLKNLIIQKELIQLRQNLLYYYLKNAIF